MTVASKADEVRAVRDEVQVLLNMQSDLINSVSELLDERVDDETTLNEIAALAQAADLLTEYADYLGYTEGEGGS